MVRTNRSAGIRRSPARRSRRRKNANPLRLTVAFSLLLLIILGAVWGVMTLTAPDQFVDGVYVNGINMGGYTKEEGLALIRQLAEERIHQNTYQFVYEDHSWTLSAKDLGASMEVDSRVELAWNIGHTGNFFDRRSQVAAVQNATSPVEFNSHIVYSNPQYLDELVQEIKQTLDVPFQDANVTVSADGTFQVLAQGVTGVEVDAAALKALFEKTLIEGGDSVIYLVEPIIAVTEPIQSVESMAEGMQLLFRPVRTPLAGTTNRKKNVKRALEAFNGMVVNPGDTVDFNKILGKRTVENGYHEAPEYDGTAIKSGIGGGVCQASTTLYQAMVRADMTIERRSPHGMTVGYSELSLDAAVTDDNKKNLVFTNDTDYPIYIFTSVEEQWARVWVYGHPGEYDIYMESVQDAVIPKPNAQQEVDTTGKRVKYIEDQPVIKSEGSLGYKSHSYKVYYDRVTGEEVQRELLTRDEYSPRPDTVWVGMRSRFE